MNRTAHVIRMQFVNRQTFIWIPLMVLGGAFIITLGIYAIIQSFGVTEGTILGGSQAPLWYLAVVGGYAMSLTFPFSQAMSVTRREFFLGTLGAAVIAAIGFAVIYVVGGLLELATDGWWMKAYFFHLGWLWEHGPLAALLTYFTLALLFFLFGFWGATIYKRFGVAILVITLLAIAIVLLAITWFVVRSGGWEAVWSWFAVQSALSLTLWGLVLVAVLAVTSYLTLRRAIP